MQTVTDNDVFILRHGTGWVNLSEEARQEIRERETRRRAAIIRRDLPKIYPVVAKYIYRACAWCMGYLHNDGVYRAVDPRTLNPKIDTSHGICPECQKSVRKSFSLAEAS